MTASTGDEIYWALCNRSTVTTPIIIMIDGTITPSNTSKIAGRPNGCNIEGGKILLKDGAENVSLIGVEDKAIFDGVGIRLYKNVNNIIIQNLTIKEVSTNGGDAISLESNISNVWIDHNEIYAAGGEAEGFDSLIDMKSGIKTVTVSYNHLHDSGRGGLVGSSSGDTDNTEITFHHNWYETIDSRTPLFRGRLGHSYNNYFNNISKSAINTRVGAEILIESNYFENVKNPIGTFYTSSMGYYDAVGNVFGDGVTWVPDESNNEYPAGPDFDSEYHIDINVPYPYNLDPADEIEAIVKANAGVGKLGKLSN